jgi:hypothetical protein
MEQLMTRHLLERLTETAVGAELDAVVGEDPEPVEEARVRRHHHTQHLVPLMARHLELLKVQHLELMMT